MKKRYHVKKEKDFQNIINNQISCANRNLVLFVMKKNNQSHFRYGLSVGKKIGNAVTRNKVKRQLREAIFQINSHICNELDFILIARPNIINLSTDEVKANVIHILKLGHIYNETKEDIISEE